MSVRARPEYSAYSVAKTGLMRMTEALAGALEGSDVRAFDVSPGVVDTQMTRPDADVAGLRGLDAAGEGGGVVGAIAAGELDSGRAASCGRAWTTRTRPRHDPGGRSPSAAPAPLRGRRPGRLTPWRPIVGRAGGHRSARSTLFANRPPDRGTVLDREP